jgi:hypothetical protein
MNSAPAPPEDYVGAKACQRAAVHNANSMVHFLLY